MKQPDAVSYTSNLDPKIFAKRYTPRYLWIILFLTLILFGCTFYQPGQVEFENYVRYTHQLGRNDKKPFEFTEGTCYRKTIFSNGKQIMSPYCTDGRLAEEADVKQSKVSGKASWYEITGYCLNQQPMASGKKVYKGAIACPAFLKLGTKVEIKGRTYTCEDRMGLKYRDGNYIDIWFEDCQDALNWGRRKIEVKL